MRNENRGYVGIWNEIGIYLIDIHEDSEKRGDKKVIANNLEKSGKSNIQYLISPPLYIIIRIISF